MQDKRILESEVFHLKAKLAEAEEALSQNAQAFAILQTIEASIEGPVPGMDAIEVKCISSLLSHFAFQPSGPSLCFHCHFSLTLHGPPSLLLQEFSGRADLFVSLPNIQSMLCS